MEVLNNHVQSNELTNESKIRNAKAAQALTPHSSISSRTDSKPVP